MKSMLKWLRKASVGAVAVVAVVVCSLLAVAPAQAAPAESDASWNAVTATPGGVSTMAFCSTPTRLTNQAIWHDCTVFTDEFIQAWIVCNGERYVSPFIGEGWWYIIGTCPPGTVRNDEGIYYYDD